MSDMKSADDIRKESALLAEQKAKSTDVEVKEILDLWAIQMSDELKRRPELTSSSRKVDLNLLDDVKLALEGKGYKVLIHKYSRSDSEAWVTIEW